jgi:hypothetical protein
MGIIIGSMKEEIREMIGSMIPEDTFEKIINQLTGMSDELDTSFGKIQTRLDVMEENVIKAIKEEKDSRIS